MRAAWLGLALATAGCATVPSGSGPVIALTFDDLPSHGALPPGETRAGVARTIIAALQAQRAPAHGFVNGGVDAGDPDARRALEAWRAAGLPLGNHGWLHKNLDAIPAADYLSEIDRNEPVLAANAVPGAGRWFRYPFLAEGSDPAKRAAVRAGLASRGYRIAAVTMDFADYAWNTAYARCAAKGDRAAIAGLERSYLDAARRQAARSRALAKAGYGRDIPYVLLMHLGAFDARMLPRLLAQYRAMGFRFVTLAQAQAHPAYAGANDPRLPGWSLPEADRARELATAPRPEALAPGEDVCS